MHPNVFLKTFWRMELKRQIFVAMSFGPQYRDRFEQVIAPAIEEITFGGVALKAYRVDTSKSGDSILTDIMDGIAHSQMVLADVSTCGSDSVSGRRYRNGNVMYEVGIALACRQTQDVLLIRDDADDFLFDVSTIPHMNLDFSDSLIAKVKLNAELIARLKEQQYFRDARVQLAIKSLSEQELTTLKAAVSYPPGRAWGYPGSGSVDFVTMVSTPRLLDKGLIKLVGKFDAGHAAYEFTPLGFVVAQAVQAGLHEFKENKRVDVVPSEALSENPPTTV